MSVLNGKKVLTMEPLRDKGLPMQTASTVQEGELFGPLDTSHLVIEDDTPVDNIFTEKQERLLTGPLYASWLGPPCEEGEGPRSFEVLANVGLFMSRHEQAIVPDIMLSLDVQIRADLTKRENRTYFVWEFGKVPEVVIEIVSNDEGGELGDKMRRYRHMGIKYYAVYDPFHQLGTTNLRSYELRGDLYIALERPYFEAVGLGLLEWTGQHEKHVATWLRWCTKDGALIPTSEESAQEAAKRAEDERKRAEDERKRAEDERKRAQEAATRAEDERKRAEDERKRADGERKRAQEATTRADGERKRADALAARLRAMGIDPNAI